MYIHVNDAVRVEFSTGKVSAGVVTAFDESTLTLDVGETLVLSHQDGSLDARHGVTQIVVLCPPRPLLKPGDWVVITFAEHPLLEAVVKDNDDGVIEVHSRGLILYFDLDKLPPGVLSIDHLTKTSASVDLETALYHHLLKRSSGRLAGALTRAMTAPQRHPVQPPIRVPYVPHKPFHPKKTSTKAVTLVQRMFALPAAQIRGFLEKHARASPESPHWYYSDGAKLASVAWVDMLQGRFAVPLAGGDLVCRDSLLIDVHTGFSVPHPLYKYQCAPRPPPVVLDTVAEDRWKHFAFHLGLDVGPYLVSPDLYTVAQAVSKSFDVDLVASAVALTLNQPPRECLKRLNEEIAGSVQPINLDAPTEAQKASLRALCRELKRECRHGKPTPLIMTMAQQLVDNVALAPIYRISERRPVTMRRHRHEPYVPTVTPARHVPSIVLPRDPKFEPIVKSDLPLRLMYNYVESLLPKSTEGRAIAEQALAATTVDELKLCALKILAILNPAEVPDAIQRITTFAEFNHEVCPGPHRPSAGR